MFRCRDGQCVTRHSRCDFAKDCFDGSDEFDCQSKSFLCLCVCVSVFMIKLFHSTFFICLFLSFVFNPFVSIKNKIYQNSVSVICGIHEFECNVDGRCIHESLRLVFPNFPILPHTDTNQK